MPQPQIAHHNTAPGHHGLAGWPLLAARTQQILFDAAAGALAVRALLIRNRRVRVRAEPDFGGAVGGRHGDEGDVDDEGEGEGWVVEVGVGVGGLRERRGDGRRREGGVAGYEAQGRVGAEGRGCYLRDDGIWGVRWCGVTGRGSVLR